MFRVDNAAYFANRRINPVVDHDVLIEIYRLKLLFGTSKAPNQRLCVLRASRLQAVNEDLCGRRKDENEHRLGESSHELLRALHVDVHYHMSARRQDLGYLRAQRSVKVAVNFGG